MGLASSQARLLSITARLTDNEYRTQRLTNARLKLTDISNAARTQYQDALQSQQFQYMTYDASGDSTNIAFTPAVAWQYQPCKNQYAIVNQAGNIMVSSIDAKNFRETDNLAEFLKRYDCLETFEVTTKTIKQPPVEPTPVTPTPEVTPSEGTSTDIDLYQMFLDATKICYEDAMAGLSLLNGADGTSLFGTYWGSGLPQCVQEWGAEKTKIFEDWIYEMIMYDPSRRNDGFIWDMMESPQKWAEAELLAEFLKDKYYNGYGPEQYPQLAGQNFDEIFTATLPEQEEGSGFVYFLEANSQSCCYVHVFGHLLPLGNYTTTTGKDLKIENPDSSKPFSYQVNTGYHWWDENNDDGRGDKAKKLAETLSDPNLKCCAEREGKNPPSVSEYSNYTETQKLMSDWFLDNDGKIKIKTLQQKIVDLGYASSARLGKDQFGYDRYEYRLFNDKELYDAIDHFVNHDLKILQEINKEPEEEPQPAVDGPTVPPEVVETTIEKLTIKDPEKAQWYTNLWYRMNGMDEPERIYKNVEDVVNDRQEEQTYTEYLLKLFDIKKNTFTTCYQELPANLASSKDWLNDALAQGWVTLQKAGVSRTTAKDKFKWSDIIYSNASDITLTQDDNAIAKAEAKYTQALREVNSKDKVFENKIRKLDTEHNALQTEYNSVKAAIDKNVERSFKVFQG